MPADDATRVQAVDELKGFAIGACELLGSALPYEPDQLAASTWAELAGELLELAEYVEGRMEELFRYAREAQGHCEEPSDAQT